jgi:uncharacterized protein YecE (DUF72 family)
VQYSTGSCANKVAAGRRLVGSASMALFIGTAGWSIPGQDAGRFPGEGSSLERYAACFRGVEINSSFHRSHRRATWERWPASVPAEFRFSVKLPKTITHQHRLVDCSGLLEQFLDEVAALGGKLAILLAQLPPSLALDPAVAEPFFRDLAARSEVPVVCEPRHSSWFSEAANEMLTRLRVARVAADPAIVPEAGMPGGWREIAYWRLHGSPRRYRSSYEADRLAGYAEELERHRTAGDRWCIFDNTASSAATGNALALLGLLAPMQ